MSVPPLRARHTEHQQQLDQVQDVYHAVVVDIPCRIVAPEDIDGIMGQSASRAAFELPIRLFSQSALTLETQIRMDFDTRTVLRSTIRNYLEAEHPDRVDEFELVFDDVFDIVNDRIEDLPDSDEEMPVSGMGFDVSSIADPVISLSVVIGAIFLKAAAKVIIKDDLPHVLNRLEPRLTDLFGCRELVSRVRHRVQRLLEEI